jgi:hypothetical protein
MATLNTLLNDAKGGNDPSSFAAELAGRPAGFIERLVTRVPPAGWHMFFNPPVFNVKISRGDGGSEWWIVVGPAE